VNPLYNLIVLTTLAHLVFVGTRLVVLLDATLLKASPVTVGMLTALFSAVGAVTSVHVGRWVDRSGARAPMLLGTAMMVAGAVLAFVWRDLAVLFVVSILIGTCYNAFFVAQQRVLGQYGGPEDRVNNFSLSSLGYSVASFLGPMIAGFAVDNSGPAGAFLLLGAIALAPIAVLGANLLPMPPPEAKLRRELARGGTIALFKNRPLRRIYAVSVLTTGTWSIVTFLIPMYGIQIGLSASRIGLVLGSFSLATIVVRVLLPFINRHFTPWQLLLVCLAVAGSSFFLLPAFTDLAALIVCAFWMGMGLGLSGPMSQALTYDASPPERIGEVLGLRATMMNISQSAVPLVSGAIGTVLGVAPVFWMVGATLLGGCYATRRQWRYRK
jgi:MFS family permease